ncbi:MAG: ATP-binding cassette domain-containing protein [Cyclobacteriaceae bacterium]|nr:ATP-binding cassette domain-containing protein [Cyclobacteriaceae bacterium HetDA_MAG_MS6]
MDLLEVKGVSKTYSDHVALQDIDLTVPSGNIFGLFGPNGAGKTTLIRIITRIISKDSGSIMLNGHEMTEADVRKIGYLPEERGLYKKMKVGDQLLFLAGLKGLSKSEAKEQIRFWFEKLKIEGWWNKKVEDLSKGMGQKIQFIATVLHRPELIILDEPFSGFDPVNANLIKENILEMKEKGVTIIFSTHRMESVEELCDHIAMINKSRKILDGPKHEIKNSFKTNTFEVLHRGDLQTIDGDFQMISTERVPDGLFNTKIKITKGASPNSLLEMMLPQIEVLAFAEQVPSMNDIFIREVEGGQS